MLKFNKNLAFIEFCGVGSCRLHDPTPSKNSIQKLVRHNPVVDNITVSKSKKVLLIRLSSLGDLVLLTSALEALSELGAETHILTTPPYLPIFEGDPRVAEILLHTGNRRETVQFLHERRYDFAIDMHGKALTRYFLLKTRATRKAVIKKRWLARQLALRFHVPIKEVSVTELYLRPIRKLLGYSRPTPPPRLKAAFPANRFKELTPYALLFPGAKSPTRIWPHYPELARLIRVEAGFNVVIGGTAEDRRLASEMFSRFTDVVDLVGKTDLKETFALVNEASFVVANDSGPAHIASALGKPIMVFFGPTLPAFGFRPPGEKVIVMEKDVKCRPCSIHGEKPCKRGDLICLSSIAPEEALNKLKLFGFLDSGA